MTRWRRAKAGKWAWTRLGALAALLGWLLPACLSLMVGGCFVPPVVIPAKADLWTLDASHYPLDAQIVECDLEGGPTLRGLYVPSDPNAPLVVHFAESGGSISHSIYERGQYEDLMHAGFASLAVDYRGVGLSGGEISASAFVRDVRAIYDHAKSMVGGDESRLVVRGTSLGSVAAVTVLEDGARPGAVVLVAPVRASTVAKRYGYATRWDAFVWLLLPFLGEFASADLLVEVGRATSPVFVVGHPDDELLGRADFGRLRDVTTSSGGTFVEPRTMTRIHLSGIPETKQLDDHIALSVHAFNLGEDELTFLRGVFPETPDVTHRLAVISEGESRSAITIQFELMADDVVAKPERLAPLLRSVRADVIVAASLELAEPESGASWVRSEWLAPRAGQDPFAGREFGDLRAIFDLSDPSGDLSVWAIDLVPSALVGWRGADGERPWPLQDVLAASDAMAGRIDGVRVFAEGAAPATSGMHFEVHSDGVARSVRRAPDGSTRTSALNPRLIEGELDDGVHRSAADRRRRLLRVLLKATGHPDRVVELDGGVLGLRVGKGGGQRVISFD